MRPSLSLPVRLLLVIAFAFVARAVAISPPFAAYAMGAVVPFLALCGAGMLIVDRSLLSHLIGLLVLGMAASVGGALLVPALPESIELGATFDALVVTFIGLALVRAFVEHNPLLDVESLRRLKG